MVISDVYFDVTMIKMILEDTSNNKTFHIGFLDERDTK